MIVELIILGVLGLLLGWSMTSYILQKKVNKKLLAESERVDKERYEMSIHAARMDMERGPGNHDKLSKKFEAVGMLRNEIMCRIEHGAESDGHLEFVLNELDKISGIKRS